jgi:hypothetical protein
MLEPEDKRKECCRNPENLEVQQGDKSDLTIQKCKVCGCRHFELSVDPGYIGLFGKTLGG